MKHIKHLLCALLALGVLVTPSLAHSHPDDPEPIASAWARAEIAKAIDLGFLPNTYYNQSVDYTKPITRERFASIAVEYVALQMHCSAYEFELLVERYIVKEQAAPFVDGDSHLTAAYYLGVIEGRGDGSFDPEGLITRQEAAVMLTRAYRAIGGTITKPKAAPGFRDDAAIADWARESVAFLSAAGILKGREDGKFDPEGVYSFEQCVLSFYRLYEQAPSSRKNGNVKPMFDYAQCEAQIMSAVYDKGYIGLRVHARVDGIQASFMQTQMFGVTVSPASSYLIYREGGVREIDLGLCTYFSRSLTRTAELEGLQFSDDGSKLYLRTELWNDSGRGENGGEAAHKKGMYQITVDVPSGRSEAVLLP